MLAWLLKFVGTWYETSHFLRGRKTEEEWTRKRRIMTDEMRTINPFFFLLAWWWTGTSSTEESKLQSKWLRHTLGNIRVNHTTISFDWPWEGMMSSSREQIYLSPTLKIRNNVKNEQIAGSTFSYYNIIRTPLLTKGHASSISSWCLTWRSRNSGRWNNRKHSRHSLSKKCW